MDLRLNNCGTFNLHCGAAPNATPACVAGACGLGACAPGYGDCDGSAANGCEVNLRTTINSCGACGVSCLFFQHCVDGACQ